MSAVFQNIDPSPPHRPGEDTLAGWRGGWGVNILEDVRHSSVLYICKYVVGVRIGGIFSHFMQMYLTLGSSTRVPVFERISAVTCRLCDMQEVSA